MGQITVQKNLDGIEGLHLIIPTVHGDSRGYFVEFFNSKLNVGANTMEWIE